MKTFIGVSVFLFLVGCRGDQPKEDKQAESPAVQESPKPAEEEPAQHAPPVEPQQEVTPAPAPKPAPAIERGVAVTGDIVDIVNYSISGVLPTSPSGKEIIVASAQGGNPLGILQQGTGKVYLVAMKQANTSARDALLPFVGTTVTVKGDIYRKGTQSLLVMNTIGKSMK